MTRQVILLLALVGASQAFSLDDLFLEEWNTFKIQHNKNYTDGMEEKFRMKIYLENRRIISEHNLRFERGEVGFMLEMNQFGDLLQHEFAEIMLCNNINHSELISDGITFISPANVELPNQVDWRDKGAVTSVKNQGQCGSCWAFSVTGALEGQHFQKTRRLVSLSEQNLIDCSKKNKGCNGGNPILAYEYIKENRGIDTESSYPYEARDNTCRYRSAYSGATVTGYVLLPQGSEQGLKEAVAVRGPVSVAIDASYSSFRFYKKGVYYERQCSEMQLDHGVLAVGYGNEDGQDYWLVKNSWGASWGDKGYIKMARNKNNNCGIATLATYPLV